MKFDTAVIVIHTWKQAATELGIPSLVTVINCTILGLRYFSIGQSRPQSLLAMRLTTCITGYTKTEFVQQVFNGQIISTQNYNESISPSILKKLARFQAFTEDPNILPYITWWRDWAQWFGSSVAVMRSPPALISTGIPRYWLCLELFESPSVGWIAVALIAVSQSIFYARSTGVQSVDSSDSMLKRCCVLSVKTNYSWGIYVATVTRAICTLLSVLAT